MCLERQSWRCGGGTHAVIHGCLGEGRTEGDVAVVGEGGRVPGGEAVRIAEVSALISGRGGGGGDGGIEVAEEIKFFAGVVFVDVDVVARQRVEGVFDGPKAGCRGVFDDALMVLVIASCLCLGERGQGRIRLGRYILTTSLRRPQPRTSPSVAKL